MAINKIKVGSTEHELQTTVANITDLTATATELNYMDGVTSNVQTQLNNKTATSVIPNDSGEIKTKYRIAQKNYTSGATWYYKICDLPTNNNGNYASAIVSGRIGGWTSGNMSYINALVWNRETPGIALMDIAGSATAMASIWNIADLVLYTNGTSATAANTGTLYVKCCGYFTFDLDLELFQSSGSITYDGTYITTTPSGTLAAQSSTTTKRVEVLNGKILVNGQELSFASHTHSVASTSANGFMSSTDKSKLDGIAAGANAYTLPTASSSTLGGVKTGSNITNSSGTISITKDNVTAALGYTPPTTNTTYSSLKNPYAVTIQANGTSLGTYDGSAAKTFNLTASNVGADASGAANTALNSAKSYTDTRLASVTTSGTGAAYTATVTGITALTAGVSFIMIPNVVSTSTTPTLNVNSLGAKQIRRRVSSATGTVVAGSAAAWLTASKPVRVTYDGSYWIADIERPSATDIYGTLPIASGGTGATTASGALTALGAAASGHNHNAESLAPMSIELGMGAGSHGGYIDFHYAGTSDDNTSRIIEDVKGRVSINNSKFTTSSVTLAGSLILNSSIYGSSLPAAGTAGRIFFKKV